MTDVEECHRAMLAAIAADKARAVDEACGFAAAICDRVGARETGTGGQQVTAGPLYADAARRIDRLIARTKARPTPDEARRLVDAVEHAAWMLYKHGRRLDPGNPTIARTALLRALGVEA